MQLSTAMVVVTICCWCCHQATTALPVKQNNALDGLKYSLPWVDRYIPDEEIYIGRLGDIRTKKAGQYGWTDFGPFGGGKRSLDFGLGRGFSGSQAAKHLMGMAAANFAGGPGRRRRRSTNDIVQRRE